MSYLSIRPFIVICLTTLIGTVAAGPVLAQAKKQAPKTTPSAKSAGAKSAGAKPATGDASDAGDQDDEKKADEKPKTAPAKPSDRSKGDVGVDLDEKLKKKKKEEQKPKLELHAVRTSPSDSISFIKKNHWTLFHLQLVANQEDTTLEMRTGFQGVPDSPHDVQYRRLVHLAKEDERLYRLPVMLSHIFPGKTVEFGLFHPGGVMELQPPGKERQPCTLLEADQFLMVVLADQPDSYNFLRAMQWVLPGSDTQDDEPPEKRRYFHIVTSLQPTKPLVADTALAWTTTAITIWDDLDPGLLNPRQQDALVDWVHSGGTLVLSGGQAATRLEQSFLTPYMPADVAVGSSGELRDLSTLSDNYVTSVNVDRQPTRKQINILPDKPIYAARLQPRPGSTTTVSAGGLPLLVERRVGRGRIVMAAFSLYQPELVNWGFAYDRFWREAILHLPETRVSSAWHEGSAGRTYSRLSARELSNVRYVSRDLGAGARRVNPTGSGTAADDPTTSTAGSPNPYYSNFPPQFAPPETTDTVAEWRDDTAVPSMARQTLLDATGIKIPPPEFVLVAAVSYLVVLVPLNWLVCRFGFRRPELAWLTAPVIIVGFSIGIVKFARVSVGFDVVSHEIDVVEAFDGQPRAHLSRFTCIYAGSRQRCEFRYEDQAAIALPMSTGNMQRGQNPEKLALDWDMSGNAPVALGRYEVHPRSIGMVRAEEMRPLGGSIRLAPGPADDSFVIDNQTGLELWDCHLVTGDRRTRLGDLAPGGKLEFAKSGQRIIVSPQPPEADESGDRILIPENDDSGRRYTGSHKLGDLSPARLLEALDDQALSQDSRPFGTRLVGWMPRPMGGQSVDPKPDRVIGFTVFVLHLEKP